MNQLRAHVLLAALTLVASSQFALRVAHASVLSPEVQVLTPAITPNQFTGASVAIEGDLALIGIPGEGLVPGTVTAYERRSGTWTFVETLNAPAGSGANQRFGTAIDIDGTRAVIGAPYYGSGVTSGNGAAFLFDWDGAAWIRDTTALVRPDASPPRFGTSVSISGERVAIGAPATREDAGIGAVVVYETPDAEGVVLASVETTSASDDLFGVSIDLQGTTLVVGAPGVDVRATNAGVAYAFDLVGGVWTLNGTLYSPMLDGSGAGSSVALSADALLLAVGAPGHGSVAEANSGAAFVFRRASASEPFDEATRVAVLPEDPGGSTYFGFSVAIDGARLLVGAPLAGTGGVGRGYLFEDRDGTLVATARFALQGAINDQARLGHAVALSGDTALLGAPHDGTREVARVGLVGVFLVPGRPGDSCTVAERCESGSCGDSEVCCERDCGPCGTCDGSGMCMDVTDDRTCETACGTGICSAGECVAMCDAGTVAMPDVTLVRTRISGCACRAGHTNGHGGLLMGLGVALALWRRRRSKS